MKRFNKLNKLIILISLTLVMILLSGGLTYAYFKATSESNKTITTDITENNILSVSSFDDLYLISQYRIYNDKELVSNNRYVIRLTSDIKIKCDLYINLDCSIDLNGHTLFLNAKSLEIYNSYKGSNTIENGTINPKNQDDLTDNTLGKLIINTLNQVNVLNSVTFTNDTKDDVLVLLDNTDPYNLYNAMYYVSNVLINDISKRENKLSYVEFYDKYDTTSDITFTNTTFLKTKEYCAFKNDSDTCTFVFDDIDLPYYFIASNINITYTSSNTDVLNNFGDYTAPNASEDITLTALVSSDNIEISGICVFNIHVVNKTVNTELVKAGKTYILDILHPHYNEEDSSYHFTRGALLPLINDEGIEFEYKVYNGTTLLDSADQFTESTDKVIEFTPSTDATKLEVKVKSGSSSETLSLDIVSETVANVTTNTSIARKLINQWHGGAVVFTETKRSETLNYVNSELTATYNITDIRYELMNDTNELYEIVDGCVQIRDNGKNPGDFVQSVMVNCIFTFTYQGEQTQAQIQVPIVYNQDNGDNADAFLLPYYTYFNDLMNSNTGGGTTYKSFEMPFAYDAKGPYIVYDIAPLSNIILGTDEEGNQTIEGYTYEIPEYISISLYYNGQTRCTFSYVGVDSLTEVLDDYLSTNSLTLADIGKYDDAKWVFTVDKTKLPTENTTIVFFYNYKFKSTIRQWTCYGFNDAAVSKIYMQGGLLYGTNVLDANLFVWMYNNFNVTNDSISTSDDLNDYVIIMDWLSQNIDFDATVDTSLLSITDFTGIQYLKGTRHFNISGYTLSSTTQASLLTNLQQMTWLESINLSNTGFYDYSNTANILSTSPLSVLSAITSLKTLDVRNCAIYDFSWLLDLPALETVYCYNNKTTDTAKDFYGSNGMVNFAYFDELIDKGVIVYYSINANNVAVTYEGTKELNDYVRLKTIEYQNVLKNGVSITNLYKNFSTKSSDYSLSSTYTHSLSWSYEGDATTSTCFMLTDTITYSGTTIKLIIKFEVERID